MMVPRKVRHRVEELGKSAGRGAKKTMAWMTLVDSKQLTTAAKTSRDRGGSFLRYQRKRIA